MIATELTVAAEQATGRYALLTEVFNSLFERAMNATNFGQGNQISKVSVEAYRMADDWLKAEQGEIAGACEKIAIDAHQATIAVFASSESENLSDAAQHNLSETETYLQSELIAQIHRDVALVRQTLQRIALEVRVSSRAQGISLRQALIQYRLQHQAPLTFAFTDRGNRTWTSKKFVRALWRHTLLAVYNETVMLEIADHGQDVADVVYVEGGQVQTKTWISLTGANDAMNYDEALKEFFHPNSNYYLAAEPTHVSA